MMKKHFLSEPHKIFFLHFNKNYYLSAVVFKSVQLVWFCVVGGTVQSNHRPVHYCLEWLCSG